MYYCISRYKILDKAMAPHSSTLAWKISWMEEPGRLQSMGSLRVGHHWATSLSHFTFHAMATHSSVLAWRLPGTGEPGGLPSLGSHRVRHDWSDLAAAAAAAAFGLNLKQVSISIICKLTLISLHDIVISADLCFIMNSLAGQTFLGVSQSISWLMVKF